jgi:Cd2+/Zn2+-exporting ATPase
MFLPAIISLFINGCHWFDNYFLNLGLQVGYEYMVYCCYIPVGFPVIKEALKAIKKRRNIFRIFVNVIATIGAFAIAEFPKGCRMLFYAIGEVFQTLAVQRAKQISKLTRPTTRRSYYFRKQCSQNNQKHQQLKLAILSN